ncbi:MAG: DUF3039 domain-containing protein [Actinomycetota bacterium]|nr:MAG: DUF3039 domain-containing protein [Actinomycetota bacterium]
MPTDTSLPQTSLESPSTIGSTAVEERVQPAPGDGDHERFAHYVQKDKIVESAVTGTPVIALCGKVWVPGRDPSRFPVCPDCKKVYDSLQPGGEPDR